jgi:hypothetical protein
MNGRSMNYKNQSYFESRPDVVKVWNDLEAYHDWCRFELCEFNPAHLYDKSNSNYRAYLNSTRPQKPWHNKKRRNESHFSR